MADLLPLPLYRRAALAALATLRKSPWVVVVPTLALGLGTLADWLLAPLRGVGLVLAAPLKALLWSTALYVWKRVLLEGAVSSADVEADLSARAKRLATLGLPLLFGTIAFLTLAYGGALAGLFVLALVCLPGLELLLLGSAQPAGRRLAQHGASWAVSQLLFAAVSLAVWLVVVMGASLFHVFAGEVAAALAGGPLVSLLWLTRGHAWRLLDQAPSSPATSPKAPGGAKPRGSASPAARAPAARPPPKPPGPPR
ncbi:MAG: hypothetical protein INH41_13305 [Myxococcaceae bacterium]|jgi:hypothetical protein|nr:hypothetical protein [Myxococcaceae bacterium]